MALRGTLEEFGLANVFQIIGQTSKTGTLLMRDRDEEVKLHFDAGCIVRCEASRRQRSELLGTMLRRAEAITEAQLTEALEKQKVTHKRLGDCLIAMGAITSADLQEFARLQTSETVFRVFLWRDGSYEFMATTAPVPNHPPIKAESLLMEGFRQIDDWPAIRKRLTSYAATFTTLQNLDELLATAAASEVDSIASAALGDKSAAKASEDSFDDFNLGGNAEEAAKAKGPLANIEYKERLVYSLIQPGRDVQKLIDVSRLGEFETCRALLNLIDAGIIKPDPVQAGPTASAAATVGGIERKRTGPRLGKAFSVRALTGVRNMVGTALAIVLILCSGLTARAPRGQRPAQFLDMALERAMGHAELMRLHGALAVFRTLHGTYPETLDALVQTKLIPAAGLGLVWHDTYAYTRGEESYTLLSPLY